MLPSAHVCYPEGCGCYPKGCGDAAGICFQSRRRSRFTSFVAVHKARRNRALVQTNSETPFENHIAGRIQEGYRWLDRKDVRISILVLGPCSGRIKVRVLGVLSVGLRMASRGASGIGLELGLVGVR